LPHRAKSFGDRLFKVFEESAYLPLVQFIVDFERNNVSN